jgi:exodeoxyribonuclease V alpha subunit
MINKEPVHELDQRLIQTLKAFQSNLSKAAETFLLSLFARNRRGDTRIFLDPSQTASQEILSGKYPAIITADEKDPVLPLVIADNFLYIQKYYLARKDIQEKIFKLFPPITTLETSQIQAEIETLQNEFKLAEKQAEAVARGLRQNLIITGGPGTGKTTVVFHILRKLLEIAPHLEIHLAAPSGKAASRIQESLAQSIQRWNSPLNETLNKLQGQTLHRLLHYQPNTNTFGYNEKNPFSQQSLFVIDEASMIDIDTFASLLKAIPEGARLFLLGDENQLPSIEAGAVLGDLLLRLTNHRVYLTQSFRSTPAIAALAEQVNLGTLKVQGTESWLISGPHWDTLVEEWINAHYSTSVTRTLTELGQNLGNFEDRFITKDSPLYPLCTQAWQTVTQARILCAERTGSQGSLYLNQCFREKLGDILIMINKNLYAYGLYNGDNGLVLQSPDKSRVLFQRTNGFEVFSLTHFGETDWESAFAITIHKSQGSEFDHVWVILPAKSDHPLLTRQILYTGITRAKKSCKVIATAANVMRAVQQREIRDTGL